MKILMKLIVVVFVISLVLLICVPNVSRADNQDIGSVLGSANKFLNRSKPSNFDSDMKKSHDMIFNILFIVGVALTVIVGGVLGIKFMLASVEDKAQIKELMVPYIAGCIIIYGAFGIWKLAVTIMNGL